METQLELVRTRHIDMVVAIDMTVTLFWCSMSSIIVAATNMLHK